MTRGGRRRGCWLLIVLGLISAACSSTASGAGRLGQEGPVETANSARYWALDLNTPETGAAAYLDAWTRGDFLLVYQLSDRRVQNAMHRSLWGDPLPLLIEGAARRPPIDQDELALSQWWLVQQLTAAWQADAMIVDLAGAALSGSDRVSALDGNETRDLGVELADGSAAELRMSPSPSGRWRVVQIGVPNLGGAKPHQFVAVDACRKDPRVEVFEGVDCERLNDEITISGISTEEFERERDRLTSEAGDDTDRQIAAAQAIVELIEGRVVVTVRQLCLLMQGQSVVWRSEAPDLSSTVGQAEVLSESFCPGEPALLRNAAQPAQPMLDPDDIVSYASLDLDSPQAAVETLVDLTRAGEAFHLVLALDRDAQRKLHRDLISGQLNWFTEESWDSFDLIGEHAPFPLAYFDSIVRLGLEADDLRIDLTAVASLSEPIALGDFGDRTGAVIIQGELSDDGETVAFVLLQAPSGRWRVRQVASSTDAIDPSAGLIVTGE